MKNKKARWSQRGCQRGSWEGKVRPIKTGRGAHNCCRTWFPQNAVKFIELKLWIEAVLDMMMERRGEGGYSFVMAGI